MAEEEDRLREQLEELDPTPPEVDPEEQLREKFKELGVDLDESVVEEPPAPPEPDEFASGSISFKHGKIERDEEGRLVRVVEGTTVKTIVRDEIGRATGYVVEEQELAPDEIEEE